MVYCVTSAQTTIQVQVGGQRGEKIPRLAPRFFQKAGTRSKLYNHPDSCIDEEMRLKKATSEWTGEVDPST